MKFQASFTPLNPPPCSNATWPRRAKALSLPRLRLKNDEYRERLSYLYIDTAHTQAEIVKILNEEFEGCQLRLPQLKKELKRLGLRRNKHRQTEAARKLSTTSTCGSEASSHVAGSPSLPESTYSLDVAPSSNDQTDVRSNSFDFEGLDVSPIDGFNGSDSLSGLSIPLTIDSEVEEFNASCALGFDSDEMALFDALGTVNELFLFTDTFFAEIDFGGTFNKH